MEEKLAYITNFDFEDKLAKPTFERTTYSKKNSSLEFLYFWSEEDRALYSEKRYEPAFFDYIESLMGNRPIITKEKDNLKCWWGQLDNEADFIREREINSNLTVQSVRENLSLEGVSGKVIKDKLELQKFLSTQEGEQVIKSEFGFSGSGLKFKGESVEKFPVLVEPWVKRVRDFGALVTSSEVKLVQNNIDSKGAYKGSLFKKAFEELEEMKGALRKIFSYYQNRYQVTAIQVDSFQFLEGGKLHFNFLCEVNHRKSMGQVGLSLFERFGDGVGFMALIPTSKLKLINNFDEFLEEMKVLKYNPVIKRGVIPLGPGSGPFQVIIFFEETERTLQHLINNWWRKFSRNGERLPSEFIVNL